jgi:hypothetical protein
MLSVLSRRQPRIERARPALIFVMALLVACTLGVVGLLASGRLEAIDAIFLAAAPWALLGAVLRPDWLLLGIIAMPASVTASIHTSRALLLITVALAGLLVTRQRLALGLGTALGALVILNVAGHLFLADVGDNAISANKTMMLSLTFYILLGLLAFNLAQLGELDGASLGTALVLGVMSTLAVGLAGYGGAWFPGGPSIVIHTYLGWMAAAALSVTLVPLFMPEEFGSRRLGHLLMTGILLALVVFSVVRAAWIAAAVTFALIAFRSRRRGYVLVLIAAIGLALLTPTARQVISRSESGDIAAQLRTGGITSGRWELWTALWERASPALPWGNGFGYMWTLSSEDLFGVPDLFGSDVSGIVPPHDDFVYLLVEFGIPGVVLLVLFWLQLVRAFTLVIRSANPLYRRSAWLLLGMMVTGVTVALIDNLLVVRPFSERFFPVAGFILGLAEVERAQTRERWRAGSLPRMRAVAGSPPSP